MQQRCPLDPKMPLKDTMCASFCRLGTSRLLTMSNGC